MVASSASSLDDDAALLTAASPDDTCGDVVASSPSPARPARRLAAVCCLAAAAVCCVAAPEVAWAPQVAWVARLVGLSGDDSEQRVSMQADSFEAYHGYTGDLKTSGLVTIHDCDEATQTFQWTLRGTDPDCSSATDGTATEAAPVCNFVITTGTSCATGTLDPYYGGTEYPYAPLQYKSSTAAGIAFSEGSQGGIASGFNAETMQIKGKALIIYDSKGNAVACSTIEESDIPKIADVPCFAAGSAATVLGRGAVAVEDLRSGDLVQVQRPSGEFVYEQLLGFLHATSGPSRFLRVAHSGGELRASANHVVFVALADGGRQSKLLAELAPGDLLIDSAGGQSAVLSLNHGTSSSGMIAPLTWSGSIVVDGVVASVYATHSATASIPHAALHALFFPARVLALATGGLVGTGPQVLSGSSMHGLAQFYSRLLVPFAKEVLSL